MILRAIGLGFLAWLIATAAFRFAGHYFFVPDDVWLLAVFAAAAPLMLAFTWGALKLLKVERGDEAEGAIGLALPGMLLDVYAVGEFQTVFPNLDPMLAQSFGALMLLGYAVIILTGVMMTKLQPADERIG